MKGINHISLIDIEMDELSSLLKMWEFRVLLHNEPLTQDVDIMLENMLYYFLQEENYEFCAVIRDEVEARKCLTKKPV